MKKYAFFDIDNTLIDMKSMFSYQEYYYQHSKTKTNHSDYKSFLQSLYQDIDKNNRSALNRRFYRDFKGRSTIDTGICVGKWFESLDLEEILIMPVIDQFNMLKSEGYLTVAVSGSSHEILLPIIQYLGFHHTLATKLNVADGYFTGEIEGIQMIGKGKGQAISKFLLNKEHDLNECYAYGDHLSDLPMLEMVGKPNVVSGDPELIELAKKRDWSIIEHENKHDALTHV